MSGEKVNSNKLNRESAGKTRRKELDVLTSIIVFGLLFFHTASIFSGQQLITNKSQGELTTLIASLVVSFEYIWIMPVMMCVAGIAAWYSLNRRTPGQFLRERLLRLGLPFLTGLVLVNPPQIYYYLKANAGLTSGFLSFYSRYWNIKFSLRSFPYFLQCHSPLVPHLSPCLYASSPAALSHYEKARRRPFKDLLERFFLPKICPVPLGCSYCFTGSIRGSHMAERLEPMDLAVYHLLRLPVCRGPSSHFGSCASSHHRPGDRSYLFLCLLHGDGYAFQPWSRSMVRDGETGNSSSAYQGDCELVSDSGCDRHGNTIRPEKNRISRGIRADQAPAQFGCILPGGTAACVCTASDAHYCYWLLCGG